jgi:hypothetical protein
MLICADRDKGIIRRNNYLILLIEGCIVFIYVLADIEKEYWH